MSSVQIALAVRSALMMTERQKDNWSGVIMAAMMVAMLLGGLLVLRLTGN